MAGTTTEIPSTELIGTEQELATLEPNASQSLWKLAWRRLKRNRLAMVGMALVIFLTLLAIFADLIAPHSPYQQIVEYALMDEGFRGKVLVKKSTGGGYDEEYIAVESWQDAGNAVTYVDALGRQGSVPKSALVGDGQEDWYREPLFLLGTDKFGRDILTRLIYGARISMTVGFCAELIAVGIGILFGALAGYFRGSIDGVLMYIANVVWSFPYILLVIALSLAIGQGVWQTFVAIGIASWVDLFRIVRGQFFSLRETEYVEAAKALGFGAGRTIFRHMLPNMMGPITVIATAGFAMAIVAEASLSFIGLGVQKPIASWGEMIFAGKGFISAGQHYNQIVYPCLMLALAVFGFNLFGDGLRDALDPKLKK